MKLKFLFLFLLLSSFCVYAQNENIPVPRKSSMNIDNEEHDDDLQARRTIIIANPVDTVITVRFDSLASLTSAINLGTRRLKSIQMPASGWVTANLTFQCSLDGVTYQNYYVSDIEYVLFATSAININCKPSDFYNIQYLKIRSGTSGTPVNQTGVSASRTLKLIFGNY